ncbi:MAG: hypothetical protein RL026_78 [Pseudomonadota bacterium]|jgi:DNA-binding transcriptional ArsR family regulator
MELFDAASVLAALAQPTRLATFRALVRAGEAGMQPTPLAEQLGIPANTLSFHLKALLAAGLVTQQRHGRALLYRADFDRTQALLQFLTDDCCGGQPCAATAHNPPPRKMIKVIRP